jgi:ribonuclease P protein component
MDFFSFSKKEIDKAFQNAQDTAKYPGLKLIKTSAQSPEYGKLLIIIPGKTGRAHDRNRIKRQIKSIFYEEKLYEHRFLSIIIVYKQALDLTFDQIKNFLIKNLGDHED